MKNMDTVAKEAKDYLLKAGDHLPTLRVFGSKSNAVVVLEMPEEQNQKKMMMAKAGVMMSQKKKELGELKEFYFITEGWMSSVTKEELEKNGYQRPSKDPKRKEVLIIMGKGVDIKDRDVVVKETDCQFFELLRSAKGELKELKRFGKGKMSGSESVLSDAFFVGYINSKKILAGAMEMAKKHAELEKKIATVKRISKQSQLLDG